MTISKAKVFASMTILIALIVLGIARFYRVGYANMAASQKQAIRLPGAKPSSVPYSTAILCGNMLFLSGVVGTDIETGELVSQDVAEQTNQCLKKLDMVLREAGMILSHAANVTVYLVDINDYELMNKAYGEHFKNCIPPARACIQVAKLVKGAKVEISMIAIK